MANNIAEFISVLRKIRDEIYPEVEITYENALALKAYIDNANITLNELVTDFNTDYDLFTIKYSSIETYLAQAANNASTSSASAISAAASAATATAKSNEIKAITTQTNTGLAGTNANVAYNPSDGKFTFTVPRGDKGEKGDSFTVGATGTTAGRTTYNGYSTGFSYLDMETSMIYFKISAATGNWSAGVPFGKGDKGNTGEVGVGITSFAFVSTTDSSGLPGKLDASDTYRVTLSNSNTFDYVVKNGTSKDDSLYLLKSEDAILNGNITFNFSPIIPTPSSSNHAATKAYADGIKIPAGIITMWSGSIATIPSGWLLCNGANGTPNLTDRFVIGAGNSYGVGYVGGSKDSIVVAHSHSAWTDTQGAHTHGLKSRVIYQAGGGNRAVDPTSGTDIISTTEAAGAHAHNVGVGASGEDGANRNLPPYYALAYIMKG